MDKERNVRWNQKKEKANESEIKEGWKKIDAEKCRKKDAEKCRKKYAEKERNM